MAQPALPVGLNMHALNDLICGTVAQSVSHPSSGSKVLVTTRNSCMYQPFYNLRYYACIEKNYNLRREPIVPSLKIFRVDKLLLLKISLIMKTIKMTALYLLILLFMNAKLTYAKGAVQISYTVTFPEAKSHYAYHDMYISGISINTLDI